MLSITHYINDLKNIQNHKDALKHYTVRFSSFNQNHQFDCNLPTCVLAQYGFYFDAKNKAIKCVECDFKYEDLTQDSVLIILNKHFMYQPKCLYVLNALEFITNDISESTHDLDLMDTEESFDYSSKLSFYSAKRPKIIYNNEESRLQTFENIKLKLAPELLAENGFYMVSKDSQTNLSKSKSALSTSSSGLNLKEGASYIESISSLVPASIHIKCAFCTYECLIFKNSLQNTMYKSPIEEHYEKSSKICPIFTDSKINNKFSNLKKLENKHNHLDWIQCLLDFDNVSTDTQPKKVIDILINPNDIKSKIDDINVKQIPKVIDQLIINEKNKTNSQSAQGLKDQKGDNVLYVPKSAASGSGSVTSDFSKLQNVLNLSDSVISEKAIHPSYTLYQTRLDSFKEWPATLSQQPADLAKAGFYYFGIKDMVKCFFCNGGLKNWDHNDDPYEDHVRWFPRCQFIKQLMGAEFVEYVRDKYKNQDSGFTNEQTQSNDQNKNMGTSNSFNSRNNSSLTNQTKGKRSVSPRTLNSRLDTNIIRKVVDTIPLITKESIKQSIETQLSTNSTNNQKSTINFGDNNKSKNLSSVMSVYGDDFKSPIEMAKLAIEIEKTKTDKLELSKSISDFIICFIDSVVSIDNIQNLIMIKHGIFPNNVRILREKGAFSRNFALVSLNKKDEAKCDEIVKDLNQNYKLLNKKERILAFKTLWSEFDEKIKPLLNKPITVSTTTQEMIQLDEEPVATTSNNEPTNEKSDSTKDTASNSAYINKSEPARTVLSSDDTANDDKSILMEENERLKSERLCVICLSKDKNVLFLPCAHLAACLDCSFNLQTCPICRSKIQATVRTFS